MVWAMPERSSKRSEEETVSYTHLDVYKRQVFYEALWAGVIPFIPGDLVKMAAAALLGTTLRARLIRAGLLDGTH